MIHHERDPMLLNRFAAHLTTTVSAVDNFGLLPQTGLSLVNDVPLQACILVKSDFSVFAVHKRRRDFLLDDEPFLEISLSPIQMGLLTGLQALLFEFVPYLPARNASWESFHHFDNSKVNLAGLAFASHSDESLWMGLRNLT
jgi:hypothetical protein